MGSNPYAVVKSVEKGVGVIVFKGSRLKCRQVMKKVGGVKTNHFVSLSPRSSVGDKFEWRTNS